MSLMQCAFKGERKVLTDLVQGDALSVLVKVHCVC